MSNGTDLKRLAELREIRRNAASGGALKGFVTDALIADPLSTALTRKVLRYCEEPSKGWVKPTPEGVDVYLLMHITTEVDEVEAPSFGKPEESKVPKSDFESIAKIVLGDGFTMKPHSAAPNTYVAVKSIKF